MIYITPKTLRNETKVNETMRLTPYETKVNVVVAMKTLNYYCTRAPYHYGRIATSN